jgi:hypothetical protein
MIAQDPGRRAGHPAARWRRRGLRGRAAWVSEDDHDRRIDIGHRHIALDRIFNFVIIIIYRPFAD